MSEYGEAYLILVIVAFVSFVGALFWGMLTSNNRPNDRRR